MSTWVRTEGEYVVIVADNDAVIPSRREVWLTKREAEEILSDLADELGYAELN